MLKNTRGYSNLGWTATADDHTVGGGYIYNSYLFIACQLMFASSPVISKMPPQSRSSKIVSFLFRVIIHNCQVLMREKRSGLLMIQMEVRS